MSIKIDVIVPIYNGEKYIDNLRLNFENQLFKEFRVIFVDDGSTDRTPDLLDKLTGQAKFENIVLHQENKGLPGARNAGIRVATAEWIVFVDCDDDILPEYILYMYEAMERSKQDMGYCHYHTLTESNKRDKYKAGDLSYSVKKATDVMYMHYTKHWIGPWSLIFRREWLKANKLEFDERCILFEDNILITTAIALSNNICEISNKLYLYYKRSNSLMNGCDARKLNIAFDGLMRMSESLKIINSEPSRKYFTIGQARFALALSRRAARQLALPEFKVYANTVQYKQFKSQEKNMLLQHRIAGYILSLSPTLFYWIMRLSEN